MNQNINISVIWDKSSSMKKNWDKTTKALSDLLLFLGKEYPNSLLSITTFNHDVDIYIKQKMISKVKEILPTDINPDGYTSLHDAIIITGNNILSLEKSETFRTFLIILTDGQDNSSKYSLEEAKIMIKKLEERGVEVIFLGVDLNSYKEAKDYGISFAKRISSNNSSKNSIENITRQLSDHIPELIRTNSRIDENPEMVRAYTEESSEFIKDFEKNVYTDFSDLLPPPPTLTRYESKILPPYINLTSPISPS